MNSIDRILRDKEVQERTGLSRVTRWRKIREGEFPQPVQLSTRSVGWRESEVNAWLENRPVGMVAPVKRAAA